MTRETKIGLLVGLAFIIVIGILLSDHLTSTSEPAMAPLAQAGDSVREGVAMPGVADVAPAAPVISPPQQIMPAQPVMTRQELTTPAPAPVQIVKIGPPAAPNFSQPPVTITGQAAPQGVVTYPQSIDPGVEVVGADPPPIITHTPLPGETALSQVAQQHGEQLVTADGSQTSGSQPGVARAQPQVAAGEYVAQPGDSLSKMASKLMGGNNKANRDAIIAANPTLKSDPNKIIAGRKYMIPLPGATTPVAVAPPPVVKAPVQAPPPQTASSQPEYWYTVKEGDNLWKIAENQLGDGSAYTAIKELNKDTLKGGDTVRVDMKLRLPARPVASAE